jgi:hypothetical protein
LKPEKNTDEVKEGEEAQGCFVIAGAQATKVFETIEHALDEVALLVEVAVIGARGEAMAAGRNHRLGSHPGDEGHDAIGIVALVSDDRLGREPFEQARSRVVVGAGAGREDEAQRIAVAVAGRVDLGAQAAPRRPQCLVKWPPFAPAAC